MNKKTIKSVRKYYRQAKHTIPLCYNEKKTYLNELKEILHSLTAENPDISYSALVNILGTPAEQTTEYVEMLSGEDLYHNIITTRKLYRIIIVATIFISLAISSSAFILYKKKIEHTLFITEETIIWGDDPIGPPVSSDTDNSNY